MKVAFSANRKLQHVQQETIKAAKICSNCNLCFEDSSTFAPLRSVHENDELKSSSSSSNAFRGKGTHGVAMPIAACTSIDCPNLFLRHRLREEGLEAEEICKSLDMLP